MLNSEQCWEAVLRRDRSQDGNFYFGVLTTGVYCRPSCVARRPLQKNVRFYKTPQDAERDGLRPCRRCSPQAAACVDPYAERVRDLCRYIDAHSGEPLPLRHLARRSGLSPFHLQRSFRAVAGVTPKQYLEAARMRALKSGLKRSGVAEAVYEAGFNSSSRVYERADTRLGMTPSQYRRGGEGVVITYAVADSPLGRMMIAATDRGLCSIQFGDSREDLLASLEREYPLALIEPMRRPGDPAFRQMDAGAGRPSRGQAATSRLAARHPRHCLPDARMELSAEDSIRPSPVLRRSGRGHRPAQGSSCRGECLRPQPGRRRHPLSPRHPRYRRIGRLPLGTRTPADLARS